MFTPATLSQAQSTELHAGYVSVAEITIEAPASAVWPHLMNTRSWIFDFHFERIVDGEANGEGRVEHLWPSGAEYMNGPANVDAHERTSDTAVSLKTLGVIPGKLWYGVNSLSIEDDITSNGVNLVLLCERNGKTLVTAIRSKESICPSPQSRKATQEKMLKYQPIAQKRWTDKYLPRLKQLVEGGVLS